jgi:hypothetical protein
MTVANTIAATPPKTSAAAVVTLKWAEIDMRLSIPHGEPALQRCEATKLRS